MTQDVFVHGRLHDVDCYPLRREGRDHLRRSPPTNKGRLNVGRVHSRFDRERTVRAISDGRNWLVFRAHFFPRIFLRRTRAFRTSPKSISSRTFATIFPNALSSRSFSRRSFVFCALMIARAFLTLADSRRRGGRHEYLSSRSWSVKNSRCSLSSGRATFTGEECRFINVTSEFWREKPAQSEGANCAGSVQRVRTNPLTFSRLPSRAQQSPSESSRQSSVRRSRGRRRSSRPSSARTSTYSRARLSCSERCRPEKRTR